MPKKHAKIHSNFTNINFTNVSVNMLLLENLYVY